MEVFLFNNEGMTFEEINIDELIQSKLYTLELKLFILMKKV